VLIAQRVPVTVVGPSLRWATTARQTSRQPSRQTGVFEWIDVVSNLSADAAVRGLYEELCCGQALN
jgi:hypothetical protein